MADTMTCPHCGDVLPTARRTRRCPHCGEVVLVKSLGASAREAASPSRRFLRRMSLFQGQVFVARLVLVLLAAALVASLIFGC